MKILNIIALIVFLANTIIGFATSNFIAGCGWLVALLYQIRITIEDEHKI